MENGNLNNELVGSRMTSKARSQANDFSFSYSNTE